MVAPLEDAMFALVDDGLFGKCDDVLELRIPSEFKDALRRKAASVEPSGMSMSNYARLVLAANVYGEGHIASLMARRISVVTAPVGTTVRERTDG